MIKFIIPGFYEHTQLNLRLIELLKNKPDLFYPDIDIHACYGNFQFCIFDGGRIFPSYKQTTKEEIHQIMNSFNDFGVPLRFVFTNNQLTNEDYYDAFGNMILRECQNGFNEVVISNEGLELYIREHYPEYNFISSTTKCLTTPELLKAEIAKNNYYMVCLDYNLNKNMKMLNELAPEERNKCEFLINAICAPGCPIRKEHYKLNSLFSLSYGKPYQMEQCMIKGGPMMQETLHQKNNLTPEEIYSIYKDMGFQYFKIEGRTWTDQTLALTYVYYMVKPEHQLEVLAILLE